MATRLGMEGVLYRNSGTYTAPTLVPINNCKDLTLTMEANEADVTTRGNNGWEAIVGALKKGTIEFAMVWDTADPNFAAIRDAFLQNGNFEVFCMSADVDLPDSEGLRCTVCVPKFTKNEPLQEAQNVDVTLRPTYAAHGPQWVTGVAYSAYD